MQFLLQLKTADKAKQVKKRIEEEYYVNPEIALEMMRRASTIEDCNAILNEYFPCGEPGSSSIV